MQDLVEGIFEIPIAWRAVLFFGILFLIWAIFGKLLLKMLSVIPWILNKFFWGLYILLEIPISALHRKFGSSFESTDNGWTTIMEKICVFFDTAVKKMRKPKSIYGGRIFGIYLLIAAYFLIPFWANLTERPFTFWHEAYISREMAVVAWMVDKDWITDNNVENSANIEPVRRILHTPTTRIIETIPLNGQIMQFNYNDDNGEIVFSFYENDYILENGIKYTFIIGEEYVSIEKQLGYIYLSCECSIRIFAEQVDMEITFNPSNWNFSLDVVTLEYPSGVIAPPIGILPYRHDLESKIFVNGWHEVTRHEALYISNSTIGDYFSISLSGNELYLDALTGYNTITFPQHRDTVIFIFESGEIILHPNVAAR
jgi:hypothetical protein